MALCPGNSRDAGEPGRVCGAAGEAEPGHQAAVQAMLRDRLLQGYKHYLEKGWADLDDRSNLENVWRKYHLLGGNGDMNDLRHTFRSLPMVQGGPPTVVSE